MIAAGLSVYLLVGAWAAIVWLPPQPWRPAAAAAADAELFEVFGSSSASRVARRVLLVLLVVVAWPVYWRARVFTARSSSTAAARHRGIGPGSTIPPRVCGGA